MNHFDDFFDAHVKSRKDLQLLALPSDEREPFPVEACLWILKATNRHPRQLHQPAHVRVHGAPQQPPRVRRHRRCPRRTPSPCLRHPPNPRKPKQQVPGRAYASLQTSRPLRRALWTASAPAETPPTTAHPPECSDCALAGASATIVSRPRAKSHRLLWRCTSSFIPRGRGRIARRSRLAWLEDHRGERLGASRRGAITT